MQVDQGDAIGPPPPPFVRRRRRRRTTLLLGLAFVVVGIPLVWSVVDQFGSSDEVADGARGDGAERDAPGDGSDDGGAGGGRDGEGGDSGADTDADADADADTDVNGRDATGDAPDGGNDPWAAEDPLPRPDPADLAGADAAFARLLGDVDASELAMIGFQTALSGVFDGLSTMDLDEANDRIRDAAARGQRGLAEVRERLADPLDDEAADAVREVYVDHLDSWATYMGAVEDDPGILGVEERTRVFILSINVTADAFARTLEEQLPDGVDARVQELADGILDRGFRGFSDSNV